MHPFEENFFFSSDLSSTPSAAAAACFDFFKKKSDLIATYFCQAFKIPKDFSISYILALYMKYSKTNMTL